MLSWSMAKGSIGIGATPGEDGNAINDEIAGTKEPTTQSGQDREDKKRFRERCPCTIPALALLGRARDARMTISPKRQTARQGQGRPVTQPVAHILIRKTPQRAQERDEQKGLFTVGPRSAARTCWQRRRASMMSQAHGQTAEGKQMQRVHQRQSVNM